MSCPIRGKCCREHGFAHGKEAEELRAGVERLITLADQVEIPVEYGSVLMSAERYVPVADLQELLDEVDARDSLAWLESRRGT